MSNGNAIIESNAARLSLAVRLLDKFHGSLPVGLVDVQIPELNRKSVVNPSMYHVFLDLPAGEYRLLVKSENYFNQDIGPLSIGSEPQMDPVVVRLLPRPSYPFPPGETLARGILRDGSQNPLPNAILSWNGGKVEGLTTERGEFVIYFTSLTEDDVIKDETSGRRFVKGDLGKTLNITVEYKNEKKILKIADVEVGKTTSLNLIFG